MKKMRRRLQFGFLTLCIIISSLSIPYQYVEANSQNPKTYERIEGWLNSSRGVEDSIESQINGFGMTNEDMALTIADVNYSGAKQGTGKVNNYSRSSSTADNGYPIVDIAEAKEWAGLFNGNPSFMTNANGLYGGNITGGGPKAQPYTGYLLAKVAEMSGGKGGPFTFRPTQSGEQGSYVGVTNFVTTQRPDGSITTNKSKYDVGETVTITSKGMDYSIYNRGLQVLNYYIYNVDTGSTEKQYSEMIKVYPISGEGTGAGQELIFDTKTWVPTKAGNYEARILFTDTHARNTKNSPSVEGQGVAYSAKFTVGNPTPPTDPGDPGPACDASHWSNVMDIYINGENSDYTYDDVPSGTNAIMVNDGDRVFFTFYEEGKYYVNGQKIPTPSDGDKRKGMWDVVGSPYSVFTVTFQSDSGSKCWTHTFQIKGSDKEQQCPVIKTSSNYNMAETIPSGTRFETYLGATMVYHSNIRSAGLFHAFERDPDDGSVYNGSVYWQYMKPGSSTWEYAHTSSDDDRRSGSGMATAAIDFPEDLSFDQAGTYKVRIDYEPSHPNMDCNFEVTITVKSCSILRDYQVSYWGTPPNNVSEGNIGNSTMGQTVTDVEFRNLTNRNGDLVANMKMQPSVPGKVYAVDRGTRKLISTAAANSQVDLYIPGGYNSYSGGDTLVFVFVPDDTSMCEKQLNVQTKDTTGGKCFLVEITIAGQTYNARTAPNPLKITQSDLNGNFSITIEAEEKLEFWVGRLNEKTNGYDYYKSSSKPTYSFKFELQPDQAGNVEDSFFKVSWTFDNDSGVNPTPEMEYCEGDITIDVDGDKSGLENLFVDPTYISIEKCVWRRHGDDEGYECGGNGPAAPGDTIEISIKYGNEGKLKHKFHYYVKWKDSSKYIDNYTGSNTIKPGTTEIRMEQDYAPDKDRTLEACINPRKTDPTEEATWADNCAEWVVHPDGSVDPIGVSKENLAVDPKYFKITPEGPQDKGTTATIEVKVMNKGDNTHTTKLQYQFDSEGSPQSIDVTGLKAGESKIIKIDVKYPSKSMDFIANINPKKDLPANENNWKDNIGKWPVLVTGSAPPPGGGSGGGPIDGGKMKIRVYDSGNRLLNLPNDGVWEKETARIEVEIDQQKISAAFSQADAAINQEIENAKGELESKYSGDSYKGVSVSATPSSWTSLGNSNTTWPSVTGMTVNGPGVNASYELQTKTQLQSNYYTGTTVPTKKDGVDLIPTKYVVEAKGFSIKINYQVDLQAEYEECEEGDEGEEVCSSGSDSDSISGTYSIDIQGDQTQFEVFDLYVVGKVMHTDQWNTNRQRYNVVKSGNPELPRYYDMYWAGERFMLRGDTPNTGSSPVKLQSIKVTMSTTNDSVFLDQPLTDYIFTGSMWKKSYERLLDGPYTFTFLATWNHGHTETDTYTITIKEIWTNYYEMHRLH